MKMRRFLLKTRYQDDLLKAVLDGKPLELDLPVKTGNRPVRCAGGLWSIFTETGTGRAMSGSRNADGGHDLFYRSGAGKGFLRRLL